ncbi:MAG: ATP-dependent zinc metalloprotease FtsH [Dehalococcoidia bacterium]|uniref:ATP-dependent zinc metalloprotease FtsH n=1 Tax=Candidatus Amarobacter glycogenicus TaxID=3140699 RepID=UPI001D570A7C|nr:ATP-dependent zinc metalloprotease FtsH [Dehalococcoidia bacterium]MBK6560371.1 ATP-dependent zinc metalloprotease FtsH [Dehalococcoidia bacterium]MBK7125972.1 ATP-dependent zinc metalloprotease FtsH [Dehalococcoidia bacterium]MBK7726171.1 ATP-dependent zinc metalloprotease FtsH [Dehalococcoidia bacterium]MBK8559549.1 ATP-dependent zinc metalloprotease FtsH [Dehalococcoidia bacterium]
MYSRWIRNSFIYLLILVAVIAIVFAFFNSGPDHAKIAFGQVIQDAQANQIQQIEVDGRNLTVTYATKGDDDKPIVKSSKMGSNTDIETLLTENGVALSRDQAPTQPALDLEYKDSSGFGPWLGLLLNVLPFLLFGLFLLLIMRQAQGSNSQAMSFGKSRARLFTGSKVTVTFSDVAGVDEAKEELAEVVEFLKYPEKFAALGARIPKGVLLVGPPGTGKTLLSRAVAGEAGVPFFSISGSEFVEMFVGVGASRVRDLFDQAKKNAPCIVFVDEIDAVGRQRGAGLGGSHDEREQTLNQILVEMDGFDTGTNVIVIAATNRPDILDPALLRPGRFDRKVILDAPDVKGREAILAVHAKGKPIADDVLVPTLAKSTPGFSGADLANLVNEAAILAARRNKKIITMKEFEEAVDRVIAGPERKSRVMSPKEKRLTAYHEGGHTVCAFFLDHHDPPHKVTIVSRGMAGGYTRFLPDEETHYRTPSMFKDQLVSALGGHAAEELIFGEASTGPSNDIEQVTRIARAMVTRWGMSDRLGPRTFGKTEEMVFLGREIAETRNYSEKIAEEIDDEVRRLIEEAQERARQMLRDKRDILEKLVNVLMEVETLEGETLTRLLSSDPKEPWPPTDLESKNQAPPPPAAEEQPRRPAFEPKPAAGLAWEGGSQSRTDAS